MRHTYKWWTMKELETLRKLYIYHTPAELAEMLGRTVPSIVNRAKKMGLVRRGKNVDGAN